MYVYFTKLSCCILNLKMHLNGSCICLLHRVCMHPWITFEHSVIRLCALFWEEGAGVRPMLSARCCYQRISL